MAGLPQFLISTQTDPYWEIPFLDSSGAPLSVEGRVFEAWITPAVTGTGIGQPAAAVKVLTFQDGLTLVPPTDGSGDQTIKNTFVHQVSRAFAQANFPRGELTADILEVTSGGRRLLVPVRLRYDDPAAIREFVADSAGVIFGAGRQPIVTPVAIAGQPGRRGAGFLTGSGPPTDQDGEDGDYWIDGAAEVRTLYGPKAGGTWPGDGKPITSDLTPELQSAATPPWPPRLVPSKGPAPSPPAPRPSRPAPRRSKRPDRLWSPRRGRYPPTRPHRRRHGSKRRTPATPP